MAGTRGQPQDGGEGASAPRSSVAAAIDFAKAIALFWQKALGREFIGAYLIGSLAHGGFSRRYSDVDLALVTEAGVSAETLERGRRVAVEQSAEWGPKLSVFWTDRTFDLGRFPPLDRVDYLDHGVALLEQRRVNPPRPTLAEIRGYLAGAPFANWARQAQRFAEAAALGPGDRKSYLRVMLYPARFCYSWSTGLMTSNDAAVAFLDGARPAGLDLDLVARALRCRRDDADPDALFGERAALPAQVAACEALIART